MPGEPNDTEPTPPDEAVTDPIERPAPVAGKSIGERTTEPASGAIEAILQGVKRERPPPAHPKRAAAETRGEVAAAYYAGPKAPGAAVDTPPPEPAVEIARTDPGAGVAKRVAETVELPHVLEQRAERRGYAIWIALGAGAVAVIVGAWWLGSRGGTRTATATATPTATPSAHGSSAPPLVVGAADDPSLRSGVRPTTAIPTPTAIPAARAPAPARATAPAASTARKSDLSTTF